MHIGSLHVLGRLLSSCANLVRSSIGGKWRRRGGIQQRNRNRGGHLRRSSGGEDGWRLENSGAAGIRQSGVRQWCLGRCDVHAVARGVDLEQDIFLNCLQRGCRTRDSRGGGGATGEP